MSITSNFTNAAIGLTEPTIASCCMKFNEVNGHEYTNTFGTMTNENQYTTDNSFNFLPKNG